MEKRSRRQQKQSPIIDGDARPDQLDDQRIRKKLNHDRKFSSNRGADVNSLEDFKDEK
jgi:hypothetical protein